MGGIRYFTPSTEMPVPEQQTVVVVAGNIAAGKSTLTAKLARELGGRAQIEPSVENPHLQDYYEGVPGAAFQCQKWFLEERAKQHADCGSGVVVRDRCLDEDRAVFTRMQLDEGVLSAEEGAEYQKLFDRVTGSVPRPTLVLWLRTQGVDTLLERIGQRGRACETGIDAAYLTKLESYYARFAEEMAKTVPVVAVPWDDFGHSARELWDAVTDLDLDFDAPKLRDLAWQ